MVDLRHRQLLLLLRDAGWRSVAGRGREVAKVIACQTVARTRRELLHLHAPLHETLDQEARRAQVLPAGHPPGDSHQHSEHGNRVSQPGERSISSVARCIIVCSSWMNYTKLVKQIAMTLVFFDEQSSTLAFKLVVPIKHDRSIVLLHARSRNS